jgi:hypothetical protein
LIGLSANDSETGLCKRVYRGCIPNTLAPSFVHQGCSAKKSTDRSIGPEIEKFDDVVPLTA